LTRPAYVVDIGQWVYLDSELLRPARFIMV
jgi:hypothetical protein